MGDIYVASVSYVTIGRNQINDKLGPKLKPDQPVAEWVKLHFPKLKVIEGVDDSKRYIFDSVYVYLRERLGYSFDDEEEEPDEEEIEIRKKLDFDWAAVIFADIYFEPYPSSCHYSSSSFNPNKIKKLFANPKQDLRVHNEVWTRQSSNY